jgi:hypothetical protein
MSTPALRSTLDAVADTLGLPPDAAFRTLGHGIDPEAFAIGDLIVRIDLADDVERSIHVVQEAGPLAAVASISPLTVPEVASSRPDLGVIVVRRLPGVSALDRPRLPRGHRGTARRPRRRARRRRPLRGRPAGRRRRGTARCPSHRTRPVP